MLTETAALSHHHLLAQLRLEDIQMRVQAGAGLGWSIDEAGARGGCTALIEDQRRRGALRDGRVLMGAVAVVHNGRTGHEGEILARIRLAHRGHVVHLAVDGAHRRRKAVSDEAKWKLGVLGRFGRVHDTRRVAHAAPAAVRHRRRRVIRVRHGEVVVARHRIGRCGCRRGDGLSLGDSGDVDGGSGKRHLRLPPRVGVISPLKALVAAIADGCHV
jgi:hypothetical protein